ncbi:hypothetical protein [Candidatus Poriferisodalis sp.]|uniref:hypothetical protein n=1 Tax=Candidatus Poriferisodalis sp. TaxID=3101277 RepID=UPI003C7023C4
MITQTGSGVPRHVEGAAEPIAVPVRQDLQKAHGHRGDSGLTTLEWLLIVAAVAGLAALAVVLVQRVVSDTSEQIAGNSARQTAAKVAGVQVADKARAAGLETGADHDEINQDGKRECDRLKILYSDAGITTTYTDGVFAGSVWTTDPNCQVTASGDTATPATPWSTTNPGAQWHDADMGCTYVNWRESDYGLCDRMHGSGGLHRNVWLSGYQRFVGVDDHGHGFRTDGDLHSRGTEHRGARPHRQRHHHLVITRIQCSVPNRSFQNETRTPICPRQIGRAVLVARAATAA